MKQQHARSAAQTSQRDRISLMRMTDHQCLWLSPSHHLRLVSISRLKKDKVLFRSNWLPHPKARLA